MSCGSVMTRNLPDVSVPRMKRVVLISALLLAAACGPGVRGGPTMNNKIDKTTTSETAESAESPVVSHDILRREPVANITTVKHILISWKDLGDAFGGHQDKRAAARTRADADKQVTEILALLAAPDADFDNLMKEYSEDAGSTASGKPFVVRPDSQLVIEFRQLALRLGVGELGVCQSDFGYHIIKRLD